MRKANSASSLKLKDRLTAGLPSLIVLLAACYTMAIQVPLLSPYRLVPADEIVLVDAAYAFASGATRVPAGLSWSHIIPELSHSYPAYTPLYLYLLAGVLRTFGLSVVTVGALHATLRLAASLVFFLISYRLTDSRSLSAVLAAIWATFVYGPTGRFEDLAIIFLLLAVYVLLSPRENIEGWRLVTSGALLGLGFLTYAGAGVSGALIILAVLIAQYGLSQLLSNAWLKNALLLFGTAALVAATWLFWIVPFWQEFRVHFLQFALPDAAAPSYWQSLCSLFRYLTAGVYTSPIPLHYSLVPMVLLLLFAVLFNRSRRSQRAPGAWAAVFVPIVIALLTARLRIHKTYNLVWLMFSILTLLPLFVRDSLRHVDQLIHPRQLVLPGTLVFAVGLQLAGTVLLSSLKPVGDIARLLSCGATPHEELVESIPSHEKVLTNNGYIFYQIRARNPIYWPAALEGQTPGGIRYTSTYDSSFRWLVLTSDFLEREHSADSIVGEKGNPGVKFSWDMASLDYFRGNYRLARTSTLDQCSPNDGLRRFSSMTREVYLYELTAEPARSDSMANRDTLSARGALREDGVAETKGSD